jgi:upstream activation factor subunit UAF30
MLRRQLESEFGAELSSKKALIRGEIEKYLQIQAGNGNADEDEEQESEEEEEEAGGSRKRSRGGGGGASRFGDILSEAMATFLGMERCPRTQVVKKLWEYIKANDLQNPKNRRQILLDDKLKTIFPGKSVNMFSMQKHLSKHVFTADVFESEDDSSEDDDEGSDEERPAKKPVAAAKKKKAAPAPRQAKKPAGSSTRGVKKDGAPAKPNGFTKPVKLAPDLAAWMGSETASRPEITKKVWAYIKERNLQDPSNKQYALSDETLKQLTGEDRFLVFGFGKLIKDKILGYAD